ncbi:AraC family transcriptional regulator [Bifidobacterium moukalabense]|uniref:AraC family transcriptional regulator n=1 Tax=Bifidobacterium moukalabense DSM 27321 TaxID=1435051 RepID=W4N6L9_9BIFI|nr:AraC family transcriptional regulator [Bifidobacterium moukalabense]ETY70654.1 AraC family transcriptional regulator [Bifidobacterium moukalabense DSM 27321]
MEHARVYTLPSVSPFASGRTEPPTPANGVSFAFCGISQTEPGHDVGPAMRNRTIIHLVVSGGGELHSQGAVFRLKANDGFIIRPDSPVTYQACATDPWTYLWLGLGGTDVQRCLAGIGLPYDRNAFHIGDVSAFLALIRSCFAYTSGSFADGIKLNAIALDFLHRLALAVAAADGAAAHARFDGTGAGDALAGAAARYITEHYAEPINVGRVAEALHTDRSHLSRRFKAATGLTLKDYLDDIRIARACDLLGMTDMEVAQVARACGFSSLEVFSRKFKMVRSVSPARFRSGQDTPMDAARPW